MEATIRIRLRSLARFIPELRQTCRVAAHQSSSRCAWCDGRGWTLHTSEDHCFRALVSWARLHDLEVEIRAADEIVLWRQVQGMATSEGYLGKGEPLAALVEAIEAAQRLGRASP